MKIETRVEVNIVNRKPISNSDWLSSFSCLSAIAGVIAGVVACAGIVACASVVAGVVTGTSVIAGVVVLLSKRENSLIL